MRLPTSSAAWSQCVRYGIHISHQLRTAGFEDPAAAIRDTTLHLASLGRAWEDCDEEVQRALEDRDVAIASLRRIAREVHRRLTKQGPNAEQEPPYTQVFPKGVRACSGCEPERVQARFSHLRNRLIAHLAVGDPIRVELVPRLEAALAAHALTEGGLEDVLVEAQRAEDSLLSAREEWERLLSSGPVGRWWRKSGRRGKAPLSPAEEPAQLRGPRLERQEEAHRERMSRRLHARF